MAKEEKRLGISSTFRNSNDRKQKRFAGFQTSRYDSSMGHYKETCRLGSPLLKNRKVNKNNVETESIKKKSIEIPVLYSN